MKKKLIISGISLTTIISLGLLVNSTFCNPTTETNYLIQNTQYAAPANISFTDDNFYKCVVDAYNEQNQTNLDYSVSLTDEQLKTITYINCEGMGKSDNEKVVSVNGIEKLESLKSLGVSNNLIENLDISKNLSLIYLYANNNKLTNIKFNTERLYLIEKLELNNNNLTNVDLSNLHFATKIELRSNKITELDVSANHSLVNLWIEKNQISHLDVSKNTKLEWLWADQNNLSNIDVSKNTELRWLSLKNNKLSSIDVSKNPLLYQIDLGNVNSDTLNKNSITSLNLKNNKILYTIRVNNTELEELILPEIDLLKAYDEMVEHLKYNDIPYEEFIAENEWSLELNLSDNKLDNIDLSTLPTLSYFTINNNNLKELDVSNNKELYLLEAENNNLKTIDLINLTKLERLKLNNNNLTHLDITKNTVLDTLYIQNNKLTPSSFVFNNLPRICYIANAINIDKAIYYTTTFELPNLEFYNPIGVLKFTNQILYELKDVNGIEQEIWKEPISILTFNSPNKYRYKAYYSGDYYESGFGLNIGFTIYALGISSDKYIINENENYIYTKNDILTEKILDNISLNYGKLIIEDNKLKIKYEEQLIKEFTIENVDFGTLEIANKNIVIDEDIPYDEFINNITTSEGLNYKIFNGETEITEGNISKGMNLKVYRDEEAIYTYEINDDCLDLSLLNVDEDKKLVKNLTLGTTVSEFKEKISTSGIITIIDKNNNELTDDKLITSGSKVKIELTSDIYEYTLSVKGDVTGTGTSTVSDVAKLYQYLKKKIDMEDCYKEAGNVVSTDNEIKINDVAKLYQFIKKKIESLED